MKWQSINELCDVVRETSFAIHRYLKNGHLEKVYENAMVHRLRKQGVQVIPQHPPKVYDEDGTVIGDYFADLFVENVLIVELKAARAIDNEHIANCSAISARRESRPACSSTSALPDST